MKLSDYYGVPDGKALIIIDETVYEKYALYKDGMTYIDLETVKNMYTHRFFPVEAENTVIFTTPTEVYDFVPGSKEFMCNGERSGSSVPVVIKSESQYYVATAFLEQSGITYKFYDDPARILITYSDEQYLCMDVEDETPVRSGKNLDSDRLKELKKGDCLRVIDGGGIRENGFIKVQTEDGVRGYVLQDDLGESYYADPQFVDYKEPKYTHIDIPGNIYLGWELLYNSDNVGYLKEHLAAAPELNVVAPTWFFLDGTDGRFISYASHDYMKYAKEKGVSVWATYKNDTIEGRFNCTEDSHTILSSTQKRRALIDSIMESVHEYELDGVNIDFEMLKLDSGTFFVEFLRELSIRCRLNNVVLSVDNYVPEAYNAYYDITEQGKIVDYVVIMGYDQHYAGSKESGSVSSLDWFTNALNSTTQMAPPERVIMGVPFYTRLWREENGGKVYVEATLNMREMKDKVSGRELTWRESNGQYYSEWTRKGSFYRIWLEDSESLKRKVDASQKAKVKGIAAWKLGDEEAGTWEMIKEYMENDHSAECALPPEK
ncbi:MAG: SH3 domain-containing protein [Lachnospiraceae bacterium]|nr:SH3 domain-containing protein [Lachnospiraceae bacterium]